MNITVIQTGIPIAAIELMAEEMRSFGALILFDNPLKGSIIHLSGEGTFEHDGKDTFTVVITKDCNHFGPRLLIGGIKQLIEEAVERLCIK